MAKVRTMTRLTSIPIRAAISRSSETARMDFPVLVLETNRVSPMIERIATTTTMACAFRMGTPRIVHFPPNTSGIG
jgi:hypothetical protein